MKTTLTNRQIAGVNQLKIDGFTRKQCERTGERKYWLGEDEQEEAERIRRLNEANGKMHLVEERNRI